MQILRKANERGHANHGWLDTFHTFSFANYYDPAHMGFRALRVINDDKIGPGGGFGAHPHRDMEIITYLLEGAVAHRDSMGTGSVIRTGDVQRMSAGTGVVHSEFNASKTEPLHLLQIWLMPSANGIAPSYEQKAFTDADKAGRLRLVASPDGRDGSVTIHTDAAMYAGVFAAGESAELALAPRRHAWVHVARGSVRVNGHTLAAGDGLAISNEAAVAIASLTSGEARSDAQRRGGSIDGVERGEVIVFDLA